MKKYGFLFLFLISCTTSSIKKDFAIRDYRELKLKNGLKVLLVQDSSLPYISTSLLFRQGSIIDPTLYFGLTSFVTGMLDMGTKNRSALEITDAFAKLGTQFSSTTHRDYILITTSTLSRYQKTLFELLAEVISQPSFPEAEIERHRNKVLAAIKTMSDRPSVYAQKMYNMYLYEGHPYGRSTLGSLKSVNSIKRKQIIDHYSKVFHPGNATLAVVGDIDDDMVSSLEDVFKDWKDTKTEPLSFPRKPIIKDRLIRLVTKDDLTQAEIRIGHIGIKRSDPDFLRLRIANTILGRGFVSRLMDHVRDNLGLTYSISSDFDARLDKGPFSITTFTKNQTTGKIIQEILTILESLYKEGVTEEEVSLAKKYLLGVFPQAIETPERLAFNLLILRLYGVSDNYLRTYQSEISKISVRQVNAAIKKHIDPYNLKILIYASSKVLPQIRSFGIVEVRNHTDFE